MNRRKDGLSAYHRLYVLLLDGIKNGMYAPGSLLPSENSLADQYHVSRVTVRRALGQLVEAGYVSKHHGQGTIVNIDVLKENESEKVNGLLSNLVGANIRFSSKTLLWKNTVPPKEIAEHLRIPLGRACLLIRRVRYIHDDPISYASIYLPEEVGAALSEQLGTEQLIIEMLDETAFAAETVDFSVSVALVDGEGADALAMPVGRPVMRMRGLARTAKGKPVYLQDSLYHPDRYEYQGKYERDRSNGARATWKLSGQ